MKNKLNKLSKRETEVLKFLLKGYKTTEIAKFLFLKTNTISTIKKNIYYKLNEKSIIQIYLNYFN
jgi:DNA-binding NarL/FixJ family response regulator